MPAEQFHLARSNQSVYRHAEEESAAAAKMGDRWERIPPDAFTEIQRRVPPIPRRRLRLVCKHWRRVIDDRTPTTKQARAMVLAFVASRDQRRAYVFDDDLTGLRTGRRELKLPRDASDRGVIMVGTCNGLLCFRLWHHDFLVANPVTGEELTVPPPWTGPRDTEYTQTTAYSFAYHPETGLYKIVHVACHGRGRTLGAFKVFTLGERAWREVPVPVGTSCLTELGLVSVGSATYWVAADGSSVMSLDLNDERVVFVATLPVHGGLSVLSSHLTIDLHGRLVFVVCFRDTKQERMLKGIEAEVWILDDGGRSKNQPVWVLQCKVVDPGPVQELPQVIVALPHVTHDEHVLTMRTMGINRVTLQACRLSEARTHGGVVRTEDLPTIDLYDRCHTLRTFAYVKTTEPLAFYEGNDCDIGGTVMSGIRGLTVGNHGVS